MFLYTKAKYDSRAPLTRSKRQHLFLFILFSCLSFWNVLLECRKEPFLSISSHLIAMNLRSSGRYEAFAKGNRCLEGALFSLPSPFGTRLSVIYIASLAPSIQGWSLEGVSRFDCCHLARPNRQRGVISVCLVQRRRVPRHLIHLASRQGKVLDSTAVRSSVFS